MVRCKEENFWVFFFFASVCVVLKNEHGTLIVLCVRTGVLVYRNLSFAG